MAFDQKPSLSNMVPELLPNLEEEKEEPNGKEPEKIGNQSELAEADGDARDESGIHEGEDGEKQDGLEGECGNMKKLHGLRSTEGVHDEDDEQDLDCYDLGEEDCEWLDYCDWTDEGCVYANNEDDGTPECLLDCLDFHVFKHEIPN